MPKGYKCTQEEVIARFREVHGDKFDYSKVEYKGMTVDVCIICPIHGEFWQTPYGHLKGVGCKKCISDNKKSLIYGVGINDLTGVSLTKTYKIWSRMMQRCYSSTYLDEYPTYIGCTVCKEWETFSAFKAWAEDHANGYREGYCLDKDILVKGNKVYSPEHCVFVPNEINVLIINNKKHRGDFPLGVCKQHHRFYSNAMINGKYIGLGGYDTPEEAFQAYKTAKEAYIKEVATAYYNDGKITKRVYDALMSWIIEITD